jgi:hypothetical protein
MNWTLEFAPPPDIPLDALWTPPMVQAVLIEAARTAVRVAGRVGPAGFRSNMPEHLLEFGDEVGQIETDEHGKGRNRVMLGATSAQISRMERAMVWPITYLPHDEEGRRCLQLFVRCRALRLRFNRACKDAGISRASAYRARDAGLALIAQGLNRDRVPVDWRDIEPDDMEPNRVLDEEA